MTLPSFASYKDMNVLITGGLGFIGSSLRPYSIVALAVGTVMAGRVANAVLHEGASFFAFRYLMAGGVAVVALLFAGPLTVFSGNLLRVWRRGLRDYGGLASDLGHEFERKWFARDRRVDARVLDAPDFSATTDLYQVASNVYDMRFVPIDLKSLILLVGAALLPFAAVALMVTPMDLVFSRLRELLL